jgi:hypothetical protein
MPKRQGQRQQKRWKTEEVVALLKDLPCRIETDVPGGDVDTDNIILATGKKDYEECLYISGFVTEGYIENPSDALVDMVEVEDGQDSRGGLHSDDPALGKLYAEVLIRLKRAGFRVVPKMDDYF